METTSAPAKAPAISEGTVATTTATTFLPGTEVVLIGLKAVAYNNCEGVTVGSLTAEGRQKVEVRGGTKVLQVKPENLVLKQPAPEQGYPTEIVLTVHDADVLANLAEPTRKALQKLLKGMPLIFDDPAVIGTRRPKAPTVVDMPTFRSQFAAFTGNVFSDWTPTDWSNVLVAGGAVLAALTPVPPNFASLMPFGAPDWLMFDLYGRRRRATSPALRTRDQFLAETMWPTSDVDIFIFGLDENAAKAKLQSLLTAIRRSTIRAMGIEHDVFFIKTPNTITVRCGKRRPVQIILRLYESASTILNGFDIDSCCVGYSGGSSVMITPRAVAAISTKVNVINLGIRGECYEHRLLKYVERGFAIAAPQYNPSHRDREHLQIDIGEHEWYEGLTLTSAGWGKWGDARGTCNVSVFQTNSDTQGLKSCSWPRAWLARSAASSRYAAASSPLRLPHQRHADPIQRPVAQNEGPKRRVIRPEI